MRLGADLDLHVGVAHQERLRVGVDRDELDAGEAGVDHAVDGVRAAAADTGDLQDCEEFLDGSRMFTGTDTSTCSGAYAPGRTETARDYVAKTRMSTAFDATHSKAQPET